jgi:D-sedoheptulose 7-phosphate isomerase
MPLEKLENVVNILYDAFKHKKKVFIMGNGGSAATASHFCCDLGKNISRNNNKRFKVIGLNDNVALLTAISNDYGYENIFIEQLIGLLDQKDIVIAFSASGNSKNVVKAVEYAKKSKALTIAFTGFNGGRLKKLADECVHICDNNYGSVEDTHLLLEHFITECLKKKINAL